jgi:hypothetical protein
MAYAYRPLHGDGVAHAFANTLLFLDLDRQGCTYPVLLVTVNCFGRNVIRNRGGGSQYGDEPDPPAPSPRRCFALGQATARILRDSPWRVVLMASSSWSHAFLTEKHHWLYPDLEADRVLLEQLRAAEYDIWRDLPLEQMEASGQHEILNWVCLAGAMAELGYKMQVVDNEGIESRGLCTEHTCRLLITLDVPEALAKRIHALEDQLPRILKLGLRELHAAAHPGFEGMAEVLETLAGLPTPEEILALRPSKDLQARISALLEKNRTEGLSPAETQEWEHYQYLEHLVRMAKAKATLRLQSS